VLPAIVTASASDAFCDWSLDAWMFGLAAPALDFVLGGWSRLA